MIRALHRPDVEGATPVHQRRRPDQPRNRRRATCVFTRVITHGSEAMASELAERRGLTLEHAHGWLRHVGLITPIDELDGDPDIVTEARSVLTDGVRRIADDVRNSLDFSRHAGGRRSGRPAVMTGPAVEIPGFAEQLGQEIAPPLEVGTVQEAKPGGFGGVEAGKLAVAAGLAVEEIPA